jgi:hypothetical protein
MIRSIKNNKIRMLAGYATLSSLSIDRLAMLRRYSVHVLLVFALLFQGMAYAVPCCVVSDTMQMQAQTESIHDFAQHAEDGCVAGSPLCCAVPSLPYTASVAAAQTPSPVYAPTVHPLQISFQQSSLERPPRV